MAVNKQAFTIEIRQTCADLIEALDKFNAHQFNTIPFQGGWTAGQVAEHLLLSAGVVEVIAGRTQLTPRPADEKVAAIEAIFLDFNIKLQSPDFIIPAPGPYDKPDMLNKLRTAWTKLDQAVCILDLSMLCMDFDLPGLGSLTRLEWIKFYIFHTQRHLRQFNRIYDGLSAVQGFKREPNRRPRLVPVH